MYSLEKMEKRRMANFMFSSLPDEILASVAEQCDQGDLFNLCLVSKRMYEGCNRVLYRHVDLEGKLPGSHVVLTEQSEDYHRTHDAIMKEQSFVLTLEEHPEYGKYVRSYKGVLCEDMRFVNYSLRHVRSVEIGSRTNNATETPGPLGRTIADNLFQSATSVTLVGCLDYNLAKSILNAIDPTMLEHLCLNMVQDHAIEHLTPGHMPGDTSEDGRIVAYGATSGLLRPLTGRCTALRTLTLRRVGQINVTHEWDAGAEDASYTELASFIDSVRSSLVRFTYEQSGQWRRRAIPARANTSNRIMDHQFRHIILPAFVSANWPRLASIELQGVRTRDGGAAGLTLELRAVVKENTKIEIKERPVSHVREFWHIVERYES